MGLLLTRRFSSLATPLFWSKKGRTSNKRWTLKSLISRLIRNQGTRPTGLGMTLWLTMMRSISCTRLTAPNGAKGQAHLRSGSRAPRVGATTLCRRWRCSWIKMGGTRFLKLRWKLQLAQLSRRRTGSNCRLLTAFLKIWGPKWPTLWDLGEHRISKTQRLPNWTPRLS